MTVEDHELDPDFEDSQDRPKSSGLRLAMGGFLVLLLVASLVLIVLEVVSLRPRHAQMLTEQSDRSAVLNAAESFTVRYNTYDYKTAQSYVDGVEQMMSTKFKTEFDTGKADVVTLIEQAQLQSKGTVLTAGVASLDPDSATVLVVADAAVTSKFDNRARHFRWQVDLVKVNGKWLIDNFDPVA